MKKIIGMHFGTKSYLKSNRYHTAKHSLSPKLPTKGTLELLKGPF
jgi:hypothetical protein